MAGDDILRQAIELQRSGRVAQAETSLRHLLALHPNHAEAHNALGNILISLGRPRDALEAYQRAIAIRPEYAEAHYNSGIARMNLNLKDQAVESFQRALALKPDYLKAMNNLGLVLMDTGKLDEAVEVLNRALAIEPNRTDVQSNLAVVLKNMGRVVQNLNLRRRLAEAQPDDPAARSSMIFAMNWDPDYDPLAILLESRQWDERFARPLRQGRQPLTSDRDPDRRLRIGYVSADFWTHSVSFFFLPLLRSHDRGKFEIICFSNVERPDKTSAAIRSTADGWHDVLAQSDDRLADLIRARGIDVLVDLSGHSVHNRLLVFARRVAPVQINYLGYPGTTGLSEMDYRLTDSHADPPGKTEHLHAERLLHLPETNWCYGPAEQTPPVGPSPAAAGHPVCFGSFNHLAKITLATIELWAKVLGAAPSSRLMLKSAGFAAASVQREMLRAFADHGIESGRIELLGRRPSIATHLELYARMDIALDTFPYHGTTTTCEALWMGVPVITLAGEVHLSRVGASLLHSVGLQEFIAHSSDEFVQLAAQLASDVPRLVEIRRTLRQRMRNSRLMDGPRFARDVEAAYRDAWRRWCAEGSPYNTDDEH
jgi:protein O-GlcNAc transferase